ncbi:MAG: SGNH/GDSL hydrolase family protein [Clostridiales bacterium]|jgi:lysophospholipase L1-like esterase|nr:SGNH/GDSL hydrolase family protein [Clostridiales bacterium]
MELKGKKIVFLGDSITEGHGTTDVEHHFVTLVGKWGECREVKNYGIGGTRFAKQLAPSAEPRWDKDFCGRIEELDEDAGIVVVFGGTNDFGHGDAPIGRFNDRSLYTFYGACHHIMTRMHERFPGKPMLILTPLHRLCEENQKGNEFKNIVTLSTYVAIIREMAEYYSIPVLDLYAESGIQPKIDIIREKFCPDGLHPNDAGHVLLAEKIFARLKSM